ncbi:MAG: carboxypeptidase regulatory-like domain-containing protein [Desulfobulbaceae bacterium]|jgi:hypothetical protein
MGVGKRLFVFLILFLICSGTSAQAAEVATFGEKRFVRTTGAPNVYTETFPAWPGTARLLISNGSADQDQGKSDRVSSARITLNGVELFAPADFKQQEHLMETEVPLLAQNTVVVELASIPDSFLSLLISQEVDYDLSLSALNLDIAGCPASATVAVRLSNSGEGIVPAGTLVGLYNDDPDAGGTLIGTVASSIALAPGEYEDLTFIWQQPSAEPGTLFARADNDGIHQETNEQNNLVSIDSDFCWTAPTTTESISGQVLNAVTGELLSGISVVLHKDNGGLPGQVIKTVTSGSDGGFLFSSIYPGAYIITVQADGYLPGERPVQLPIGATLEHQDLALSPVLNDDEVRIVLTWGENPEDLEAHLTAPNPDGCRHHCYYWDKEIPGANLDLDDRHSYGPETITITERIAGTYRYYVHDFTNRMSTNSIGLGRSGARVTVYQGANPPQVFTVPAQNGTVWHVFDLDGTTGAIAPVQKMTYQNEPGRIDFPVITTGINNYAYWGQLFQSQMKAVDPDDDPLTYSLTEAPAGMTIDPDSGLIQWTPSGTQKGTYYVTVRVADGRCGEDTLRESVYEYFQPGIQFSVSPCSGTNPGGDITLTWSTSLAETVFIDQGIGLVGKSGSLTLPSPDPPVVYTLTAANGAAQSVATTPMVSTPSLSFSPSSILRGSSTTLSWNGGCNNTCTINQGIGEVPLTGSKVITPAQTTLYTITCANAAGSRSRSTYIYVSDPPAPPPPPPPPPPPAPTSTFTASPTCTWSSGDPITLSWTSKNTTSCSISPNVGTVDLNGSVIVNPTATTTYTLSATGSGGTINRSVTVPQAPSASLSSSASYIDLGNSVTLTWSTSCTDSITLDNTIGAVASSGSMVVTPQSLPVTYTLTATNERQTLTRSVTIRQFAPTSTFSADPTLIKVGEQSTLTWTSTRATSCSISPNIGAVDLNGSIQVTPTKPTTYTLTATGPGGTVTRNVTVGFVNPTADIQAVPETIKEGESTTLSWVFSNATSSVIDQGIGEVQLGQTLQVSPTTTTTYTMTATGPGGTATDRVTVTVIPANPPPTVSISASPMFIKRGEEATLSWTSTDADTVTIDQGIGTVSASGNRQVSPTQTTTYTITATGAGGTRTASVKVTVLQPPPTVSFTGEPATIKAGESATLTWTATDAQTVTIDQGIGTVAVSGSRQVSPTQTTTYRLTATGPGGTTGANITITVLHDPPTATLTAEPVTVEWGNPVTLTWQTNGADQVTIDQGVGSVDTSGSKTLTPEESTTYTLTATGPGGTTTAKADVTVTYPVPTVTLTATPVTITAGESATLAWSTTGAATSSIEPGVGTVQPSGTLSVAPTETTTYTLTATNPGQSATGSVTVTVKPAPPTAQLTADPLTIDAGGSSTLTWSTSNADAVTIDQGIGTVAASGSKTVSPAATTTYTLTATGPGGTTTDQTKVTVNAPITLTITSPADGETVTRTDLLVTGTVTHAQGLETGVTVNGVVAQVHNNTFAVNHVPVQEGTNSLIVTATDVQGGTVQKTIDVTVLPGPKQVNLVAMLESGLAPVQTDVRVDGNFPFAEPVKLSYSGPGNVEYLPNTDPNTFTVKMTEPGLYTFTGEAKDDLGTTHTGTIAILAMDRAQLDTLLQAKWNGMKAALNSGQINSAISYFHPASRSAYQAQFEALSSILSQVAGDMGSFRLVEHDGYGAIYDLRTVRNNEELSFQVLFVQDAEGIWRIMNY